MKRLIPLLLAAVIPAATATLPEKPAPRPAAKAAVVKVVATPDTYKAPETGITSPAKVKRGQIVVLSAKPFEKPAGLDQYTYVWVINPAPGGTLPWPDGSKIAFGSGGDTDPDHYEATLVANYVFVDKDGKNPVLKTVEVATAVDVDGGVKPVPPAPGPDPLPPAPPIPPAPTPAPVVVPDGVYKIAPAAYELAKNHPAAECQALAKAYRTLSAASAASKAELVNATVPAVHDALGASLDAWRPDLIALAVKVNALNVVPVADCRVLYAEIANGLEARK